MRMLSKRFLRGVTMATPVLLLALTTTTAQAAAGASRAAATPALSHSVIDKVIVVFKNQVPSIPDTVRNAAARKSAVKSVQAGVMSQLSSTNATNVHSLSLVNAVTATVSPFEAHQLAANPAVAQVVPDRPIPLTSSLPWDEAARQAKKTAPAAGLKPLPGACPAKGKVQLDPQALSSIHAAGTGPTAQGLGYTGKGVKVAWIADGIDINNPDFIRANGQHVFSDYQDFSGTGTDAATSGGEAFLDASSIAAQGRQVYNVQNYGAGLSRKCDIRVRGVAPGASLVGLNVFGSADLAFNSVFLEAINYAVNNDHVNVLNESFGSNPFPDSASLDLTRMADDAAVKAGVTVTVSTGDAGVTNTIGSPSSDKAVISAGASTTYRAYAQTGIGGIGVPGVKGWLNNNISGLSSAGFTQAGNTVDVVAPGDLNWALCTPDPARYAACTDFSGNPASVELSGGTSEAAPLTAGVAALVIQAYAKTHGGHVPTPAVVKRIIVSTAENINAPGDQQGAGLIDAYQAVRAAASYHGSTHKSGHAVLDSATQFNATGQPHSGHHFAETLTNTGTSTLHLGLSSRSLGSYHAVSTRSLQLDTANGFSAEVTFHVARGQARLNASVALKGVIDLSLISPSGKLAHFNLPQGQGNYGNSQVADPQPGTWTALIAASTPATSVTAKFQASTAKWASFGRLSAHSLTVPGGASRTVHLTVSSPGRPGDRAGSIQVRSSAASPSFARVTSIPVTLRALIPVPHSSESFTGTLTGGNGRAANTGQTAYYQIKVPSGLKALNVQVKMNSSANPILAELVDPAGEAASTAVNGLESGSGSTATINAETGTQLHVVAPKAGTWSLIVDFFDTVSGTSVAQPFTVTVNDTAVKATAAGLPDSAATSLPAGTPVTVKVKVTNTGKTPEAYFVDGRLSTQTTSSLAAQTVASLPLPNLNGTVPAYLVPSHTSSISAQVTASASQFFDFAYPFGDPDLISSTGTTSTGGLSAPDIAAGDWTITPFLTGPTGASPAPVVTATTSMQATYASFDPAVTAPTGDLWQGATNAAAPFAPVVVKPGKSATIPVTITPSGTAGAVVSGTLYLADSYLIPGEVTFNALPGNFPEGSDVAAFPYSYTIASK
jgi:subtilisin family serine protease